MTFNQERIQRERDELLEAAAFELDQKLHLTIAVVSEEKANALIDLLRVQFVDISHELDKLRMCHDETEASFQSERIRQWLSSLNRSSFVPLTFRIKYLSKIEAYLDLIAQDMGGHIMRAYKTGLLHIKDKAKEDASFYQDMVHVAGVAVELAVRNMLRGYSLHMMPSVLDVRQTFDIAKLGLVIARTLDQELAKKDVSRLKQGMIKHELLRRVDMFGLSDREQTTLSTRLQDFVKRADVEYLRPGEAPNSAKGGPYLVSKIDFPHLKPRRSGHLSDILQEHAFLIHASEMFSMAAEALEHSRDTIQFVLDVPSLNLEEEVSSFALCGSLLLGTFKSKERFNRKTLDEVNIVVPVRLALLRNDVELTADSPGALHDWTVANLSRTGVMLEGRNPPFTVGSLIEISLGSSPRYGLVRWFRSSLQGDIHCGIEFVSVDLVQAKVTVLNFAASGSSDKFWYALLEKIPSGWNVWLGGWSGIPVPMSVDIKQAKKARSICRLMPTGEMGVNYAVFHISEVIQSSEEKVGSTQELQLESSATGSDILDQESNAE